METENLKGMMDIIDRIIYLEELRGKIDVIDKNISGLLNERFYVCRELGKMKSNAGSTVADYNREKKVLCNVTANVDEDKTIYVKQVYEAILAASKAYQMERAAEGELGKTISSAIERTPQSFPVSASVACQGVEGAYSMLAAERLFEVSDILYFKDFDGVFSAIENGLCSYGVLPIENSTAGSVLEVYDLILKHNFHIVRTINFHIKHSLLAKKGASLQNIKEIVTHEQAAKQCAEFIKTLPGVKVTYMENTAVAARYVAEGDRKDVAAICSPKCAKIYGLKYLASGIQDVDSNFTRFICIAKELEIYEGADRISLVMSLPHETGALYKTLSLFASLGLNLTKLESRPIPGSNSEFAFYFDFVGDVRKRKVRALLSELQSSAENFAFLGAYGEAKR